MELIIRNTWKELEEYIEKTEDNGKYEENWSKYVVEPFWDELCSYAPFDLGERKPKGIKDIEKLKKQLKLLKELDMTKVQKEMLRVVETLPNFDDDPITVVFFPLDDENTVVKERQNGVIGTSLFGNLMIQINPLADEYSQWISYVFAHEYHHTVWGNYWFVIHGGELQNKFIDSLIIDGEADSFAISLYPELKPAWVFDSFDNAETLWNEKYKSIWERTDVEYVKYMFGDEENEIPWCAGYSVGYMLVQKYLEHENKNIVDILKIKPEEMIRI